MRAPPRAFEQPIHVTRPLLPPLAEYTELLASVWACGWLTNGGPQHVALERELADALRVHHLSLVNNGTTGLSVACAALALTGEVVTTPFTFPATPHALLQAGVRPVFADIDPHSLCLDAAHAASLVTGDTSAILGVHVYGNPCDVRAIDALARARGLAVLYDAAHAFGTEIDGHPLAAFGDATMLSFHATKLFHSAEGGALVVRDAALKTRIDLLKNFGIRDADHVEAAGINGKMNELQAALGRVVLRHLDAERQRRAIVRAIYRERLDAIDGLTLLARPPGATDSLQYMVVRVDERLAGCSRDALHERLKRFNIHTRKYFFPLCSDYPHFRHLPSAQPERLPHACRAAAEVMTLPLYGALDEDDVHAICDALVYSLHHD